MNSYELISSVSERLSLFAYSFQAEINPVISNHKMPDKYKFKFTGQEILQHLSLFLSIILLNQ